MGVLDLERPFEFGDEEREYGEQSLSLRYDVRTICNVIRRIHLLAGDEEVTKLCAEAIWMAKRMNKRLRHYHKDWDRGLWVPETKPLPTE